ncbi:MAG: hypothetical protein OK455_06055 [Thaumarchaeota archaeon]|nr:hypothetical protein [Nitrososphaerota archaeon]
MISREALSLYVIKGSLGLGGSLLAAIFVSEAVVKGGFLIPFAVGVFIMVGLTARFFGSVSVWVYCVATLGWVAFLLLVVGLP